MSKKKIIVYKGMITIRGEFHSGAGGTDATDHPLVRDTLGNVILRGESFAGLIRQELVRQFGFRCKDYTNPESMDKPMMECDCAVCRLMGHSRIPREDEKIPGYTPRASRIKITGGVFGAKGSRIRHGVAIDRRFQVASEHKKYDLEALLDGAKVPFEFEVEDPTKEEIDALECIFLEMEKKLLFLGGKKSAGFGNYTVEIDKYEFDLATRQGVLSYLLGEFKKPAKPSLTVSTLEPAQLKTEKKDKNHLRLSVPFDLWFPELFLVNDPLEASLLGSDHVSVVDASGRPWLPPSTIRGVFRSRAEQIIRTLNTRGACDPSYDKDDKPFKPLLSCSKGIEDVKNKKSEDKWPSHTLIESDDFMCLACQLFGNTFMAGRIRFVPGKYCEANGHQNVLNHFLAVCRFSGGGKDGAKFDAWALYDVLFKDCRIIIEDFQDWQVGLTALVLKDFFQGDIRMGFGTRKGYGQVICNFENESRVVFSEPGHVYENTIGNIRNGMFVAVKSRLEQCVSAFRNKAKNFGGVAYDKDTN